jgi:hypothetical protein
MNLSQPLLDALKVHAGHYQSFGDYSVTALIDPPRKVALQKRYKDKLSPPPESQIASFIGTGVHKYFEDCLRAYKIMDSRYELERGISEKIADRLITGTFDILYDNENMYDIKTCKVWKLIFDPNMEDWHEQQNIYAYLLHLRGIDVKSINIIAVYLDWIESNAVRDRKTYPQQNVVEYPLKLWSWDETEIFLNERLALHKACENVPDDELPECTRSERWERHEGGAPVKYAIMSSKDARRATRVFTDANEALKYFKEHKKLTSSSFIEIRYARRKRCEKYCACNQFCDHYIEYTGQLEGGSLNDYWSYDQIHQGKVF